MHGSGRGCELDAALVALVLERVELMGWERTNLPLCMVRNELETGSHSTKLCTVARPVRLRLL